MISVSSICQSDYSCQSKPDKKVKVKVSHCSVAKGAVGIREAESVCVSFALVHGKQLWSCGNGQLT